MIYGYFHVSRVLLWKREINMIFFSLSNEFINSQQCAYFSLNEKLFQYSHHQKEIFSLISTLFLSSLWMPVSVFRNLWYYSHQYKSYNHSILKLIMDGGSKWLSLTSVICKTGNFCLPTLWIHFLLIKNFCKVWHQHIRYINPF